jgi:hypothetical protein
VSELNARARKLCKSRMGLTMAGPHHERSEVARRLDEAVAHLRQDLAKVEFWACAVQAFAQPVPRYDAEKPLTVFDLRKPISTKRGPNATRQSRPTAR